VRAQVFGQRAAEERSTMSKGVLLGAAREPGEVDRVVAEG